MLVLYWELGTRGKCKDQESNDGFIITESSVQCYSAAAVSGSQSVCNFCWSGLPHTTHVHVRASVGTDSLLFLEDVAHTDTHKQKPMQNVSHLNFTENCGATANCPVNLRALKASSKRESQWERNALVRHRNTPTHRLYRRMQLIQYSRKKAYGCKQLLQLQYMPKTNEPFTLEGMSSVWNNDCIFYFFEHIIYHKYVAKDHLKRCCGCVRADRVQRDR